MFSQNNILIKKLFLKSLKPGSTTRFRDFVFAAVQTETKKIYNESLLCSYFSEYGEEFEEDSWINITVEGKKIEKKQAEDNIISDDFDNGTLGFGSDEPGSDNIPQPGNEEQKEEETKKNLFQKIMSFISSIFT